MSFTFEAATTFSLPSGDFTSSIPQVMPEMVVYLKPNFFILSIIGGTSGNAVTFEKIVYQSLNAFLAVDFFVDERIILRKNFVEKHSADSCFEQFAFEICVFFSDLPAELLFWSEKKSVPKS